MAAPKLEGKHFSLVFSYYSGSLYVFQCVVMQSSPIWLQIGRGMVDLEGGELCVPGELRVSLVLLMRLFLPKKFP